MVCIPLLKYFAPHRKRGCEALDAPVFKGKTMHDFYRSYFYAAILNALRNAHHLWALIFVRDQYQLTWADEIINLLLEIKSNIEASPPERQCLLLEQLIDYETRFDAILASDLRTCPVLEPPEPSPKKRRKPKQHPVKNLLDHLVLRNSETLAFMYDFKVPIDNNQAERDLRKVKLKHKLSRCFRSEGGAEVFYRIHSYHSTARKNGQRVLDILHRAVSMIAFRSSYSSDSPEFTSLSNYKIKKINEFGSKNIG